MSGPFEATEIFEALTEQANAVLGSSLGGARLEPFNFQNVGAFPYVWQDPNSGNFNTATHDWINHNFAENTQPREFADWSSFVNEYYAALSSIDYALSRADQATLGRARTNAQAEEQALINAWVNAMGPLQNVQDRLETILRSITNDWSREPTTLAAISNSSSVNSVLNQSPYAAVPIIPALVTWLNALGSAVALQSQVTQNRGNLALAMDATANPSQDNGAVEIGKRVYAPAFEVSPHVSAIESALQEDQNTVALKMSVKGSSGGREARISIGGGAETTIQSGFLSISVDGDTNFFSNVIANENNSTIVLMEFTGATLVKSAPAPFSTNGGAKNWFWMDPISETDKIGYPPSDATGFQWVTEPHVQYSDDNGPFGYAGGIAIAKIPTIMLAIQSADFQTIGQTFEQAQSVDVSFLGIKLEVDAMTNYHVRTTTDASSQTATITLIPATPTNNGNDTDRIAWVLGVQPVYPAT